MSHYQMHSSHLAVDVFQFSRVCHEDFFFFFFLQDHALTGQYQQQILFLCSDVVLFRPFSPSDGNDFMYFLLSVPEAW